MVNYLYNYGRPFLIQNFRLLHLRFYFPSKGSRSMFSYEGIITGFQGLYQFQIHSRYPHSGHWLFKTKINRIIFGESYR